MTHSKPTAEELQANIDKTLQDIEKADATPSTPAPETQPEPSKPDIEVVPSTPDEPVTPEPEKKPEVEPEPVQDENYWKNRYTESTREAQVLASQNKRKDEVISQADVLPEPTDEDLKVEAVKQGFSYDDMSEVEKSLFKTSIHTRRKLEKITEVTKEGKDIEEWHGKVDAFIGDPKTLIKYELLEGKTEEFKQFASRPSRRGADFNDLVSAFLFEAEKSKPIHKGKMFETGSGGPNTTRKPKEEKMTADQGRLLMKTNYKAYIEALKAGKIANE